MLCKIMGVVSLAAIIAIVVAMSAVEPISLEQTPQLVAPQVEELPLPCPHVGAVVWLSQSHIDVRHKWIWHVTFSSEAGTELGTMESAIQFDMPRSACRNARDFLDQIRVPETGTNP